MKSPKKIVAFVRTVRLKKKANPVEITKSVIQLLEKSPLTSREIENQLHISSEATIFAIQLLLENNRIKINSNNQYYLI